TATWRRSRRSRARHPVGTIARVGENASRSDVARARVRGAARARSCARTRVRRGAVRPADRTASEPALIFRPIRARARSAPRGPRPRAAPPSSWDRSRRQPRCGRGRRRRARAARGAPSVPGWTCPRTAWRATPPRSASARLLADDRHALHHADLRVVVGRRIVLDRAIVPEREAVLLPAEPALVLRHVGLAGEVLEELAALVGRQDRD